MRTCEGEPTAEACAVARLESEVIYRCQRSPGSVLVCVDPVHFAAGQGAALG